MMDLSNRNLVPSQPSLSHGPPPSNQPLYEGLLTNSASAGSSSCRKVHQPQAKTEKRAIKRNRQRDQREAQGLKRNPKNNREKGNNAADNKKRSDQRATHGYKKFGQTYFDVKKMKKDERQKRNRAERERNLEQSKAEIIEQLQENQPSGVKL